MVIRRSAIHCARRLDRHVRLRVGDVQAGPADEVRPHLPDACVERGTGAERGTVGRSDVVFAAVPVDQVVQRGVGDLDAARRAGGAGGEDDVCERLRVAVDREVAAVLAGGERVIDDQRLERRQARARRNGRS